MKKNSSNKNTLSSKLAIALSRIEAVKFNIEHGYVLSDDEKKEVLKKRAVELSKEFEPEEEEKEAIEITCFGLAYETYAFQSDFIKEVYTVKELSFLPGLPEFILGIINLRGRIISVVDLRKFFGLPESGLTDFNKVIVLRNERMEFGILADTILGIKTVYEDDLQKTITGLDDDRKKYLKGITKERIIVLDSEKILNDPVMIINDEI